MVCSESESLEVRFDAKAQRRKGSAKGGTNRGRCEHETEGVVEFSVGKIFNTFGLLRSALPRNMRLSLCVSLRLGGFARAYDLVAFNCSPNWPNRYFPRHFFAIASIGGNQSALIYFVFREASERVPDDSQRPSLIFQTVRPSWIGRPGPAAFGLRQPPA